MKIAVLRNLIILVLLFCLKTNSIAQDFAPLIKSAQQETLHFADLIDNKILTLNHFDSHLRASKELTYDSLLITLSSLKGMFSSLILYNQNIHPILQVEFISTKDSIFIYQNFVIRNNPQEIVLFGTLLTPEVKTRTALWIDYDFKVKRKIIYDSSLNFYIKNGGVSSHFVINQSENLLTNTNGSTVELNNTGKIVNKGKYQLGKNYFQNDYLNYLTPFIHGLSISDPNLNFVNFIDLSLSPPVYHLNYKYIINLKDNYILLHSSTTLDFDCERIDKSRNAIIKYNTNNYQEEFFYIDSLSNCQQLPEIPDFSIDYFNEDYIFIIRKYNSCGFINLDQFNGENICNIEFMEVQCIDKNGQLRWRKELGGDAAYLPKGIVATPDSGCVVFTNRYERGVNTGRESDLYYTKLDKNGNIVKPIPVSIPEPDKPTQSNIQLYPNPFNNLLHIQPNHHPTQNLFVEIYDVQGQLVLAQKVNQPTISVAHLSSGVYTAIAKQGDKTIQMDKLLKL